MADARKGPEQAVAQLATDPNSAAPEDAAVFVKTRGDGDRREVGDEYVVRMPGPWDGPVRVVHRTPTSFRLATLSGSPRGRADRVPGALRGRRALVFEIESWARSGDRVSDLLYNKLLLAKEIQLQPVDGDLPGRRAQQRRPAPGRGGCTRGVDDPLARRARTR